MKSSMSCTTVTLPFLWFLLLVTVIGLGLCHGSFNAGCIQGEGEALLKLKHDLTDPSNRLASWVGNGNCCRWYGVVCHNLTGHVLELHLRSLSEDEYYASGASLYYGKYLEKSGFGGKVSPSLLNLKHLKYLDLSNNNFEGIPFPKFLGSMGSLRYLDLSNAGFGGMIPHQLGNLSNLQYLNLYGLFHEPYVENLNWLTGLSSLKFLSFTFVSMAQASDWLNVINTLPSLVELHFSSCGLPNVSPLQTVNFSSLSILDLSHNYFQNQVFDFVQNITSLKALDLSFNDFNSSIPSWLYGFSNLQLLNLRVNQLQGKISSDIGNMTSLVSLDLSFNNLGGRIPASFKHLCNLKSLFLGEVKLGQEINDIFEILFPCGSKVLEELDLEDCHLTGYLPSYLGQFKNLVYLILSGNSISGPIPISIGDLKSMKALDLSQNSLNGSLPLSIGGLKELERLDLSYNSLKGDVVSEVHFANLTKLSSFYASGNQLRLRVSPNWNPPPQLYELDLGSWSIGPQFPHWIQSLKNFWYLNLSSSGIAGTIPVWFWNLSSHFSCLNISHNQIHGVIPNMPSLPRNEISGIGYTLVDLSSNNFQGPLPYIFSNVRALYLSNNSFSGPISQFLCYKMDEPRYLEVLDLGENLLSGEMPDCLMKWKWLEVINLNNNKLSGNIPWSIGDLTRLESLKLRNNSLSGEIPLSLRNCTELSTLDLGENELVGNIPTWIGERFSNMVILTLRTNKLHGHIPDKLCMMSSLYILDLADNNLSGAIPKCLNNFSAVVSNDDSIGMILEGDASSWPFFESTYLVTKGKMNGYSSILKFVRAIDLSKNKLSGEIPEEITSLKALRYLNLSHNLLTGTIPANIGAMESVETIDFSQNQLFGEIPQGMAKLTFLSLLNLSFNNLSGRIPSSTQIRGFSSSSFMGNEELCGVPLTKNCTGDGEIPSTGSGRENGGNGHEVNWFYVSMALGFVVGFWGAFGPLVINRRWRHVYFRFLDNLWDKIWWLFM